MSSTNVYQVASPSGLQFELCSHGAVRRIDFGATLVNLFLGNELEGGPSNIYLRRAGTSECIALLGPRSPTTFVAQTSQSVVGAGRWSGVRYEIELKVASDAPVWFWHVRFANDTFVAQRLDLIYAQDLALAPYATARTNEYYVSQYLDHTPLMHPAHGVVIATRQNLPADGRHPWSLIGALRKASSFSTDALQFHGLATRAGQMPIGLQAHLSGRRLQHEHAMAVLQSETIELLAGGEESAGFFGMLVADHPAATDASDLVHVDTVLALPEAKATQGGVTNGSAATGRSLFATAPLLNALELSAEDERALFDGDRRHEEFDSRGKHLSFFTGVESHVVLRAKELHVERPHGHVLRTGSHLTPDERALTTTLWMNGVFNSMLTQGHVSFNRLLSTQRSYLCMFRSQGQRMFVEIGGQWLLLDLPSAFEMQPDRCRWLYRYADGLIEVSVSTEPDSHAIAVSARVLVGEPLRILISHHIALNGDDGAVRGPVSVERSGEAIVVSPAPGSELAQRFPGGGFRLVPEQGTSFAQVGGDELLFDDGQSRNEPFLCLATDRTTRVAFKIVGELVHESQDIQQSVAAKAAIAHILIAPPSTSEYTEALERLADIIPWFTHNALIHYLSPRGLEQFTGGGWGTRDVTQGPVELLLAAGNTLPLRDLLLRVMRAQNSDGDWPQWFMFFERDRAIRAGDSHGDIVFWPVLALAQYLLASGDASILEERICFFDGEPGTVWAHIERALALIERRAIPGTRLAAYGHGDWNDSLQPADPTMRERLCSAWTVTLHHQTLTTLARALRSIGRDTQAQALESIAEEVRNDFQRLLIADGVLAGYASFEAHEVRYLLHPRDRVSGVHYSALAMIHAILQDLFTAEQARAHLKLMDERLLGPDGIRLFDRPMPYRGGPQRLFQRAESAAFFGREIGLMYMHAHLRYAQALAHLGEAERFFKALCQANPIGIRSIVPRATLRQANCYYSSSDAAFEDRYRARSEYDRIKLGTVGLDGGWRVYSSGAGIAVGLIVRRLLGLDLEAQSLRLDPVIPAALNGLRVDLEFFGKPLEIEYSIQMSGCGVAAVELNGRRLDFVREDNVHRTGAALIAVDALRNRLQDGHNTMKVQLA
jgi:cellobiose phosphorylase